ncbi:hypothetical protein ACFIOY_07255 [Bradyrhizobium sp. TZ2]
MLKAEDVVEIEPAKGNKPAKTITKPGGLYIMGSERHESAVSTTSSVAAPVARAIPAARNSSCRWKTI